MQRLLPLREVHVHHMRERVVTCGSSHHLRWYEPPQNEHNVNYGRQRLFALD
jgi:hypothetical protein